MFNPYKTTYGSLVNTFKLEQALAKYVNLVDIAELEFEYPADRDTRLVFITGYNDEEKELPAWDHPFIMKTLKGTVLIVSDVRQYVTATTELSATLEDIVRDKNSLDFIIARMLITKEFIDEKLGDHRALIKPTATALGVWLSNMITAIVPLDPVEQFKVEIVSNIYANTLFYPADKISSNMGVIVARVVSSKHAYKFSKKEIAAIADSYVLLEAADSKLGELIENISRVLPDSKNTFISIDSLIGVLNTSWYGPGKTETPIIALEDMPTWISLVYSVTTNKSYQKTRIGSVLNKFNRVIDAKLISKHVENLITEFKVS